MENRKNFISSCIVLLLILSSYSLSAGDAKAVSPAKKITLGTSRSPESPSGKFLSLIYTEAFKRIDMEFVFRQLPEKRASEYSDQGVTDGELTRVFDYNDKHPNLIRVAESHYTLRFLALTTSPDIRLREWESLRNTPYKVNYRHGVKKSEEILPRLVNNDRLEAVVHIDSGLKKLLEGRCDIYVDGESNLVEFLNSDEFKNSGIRIAGVMETVTSHAFLHKKHTDIVSELSSVLKQMKDEGLFEKYRKLSGYKELIHER